MQSNRRPRVLFVASEVHPFARTGGLADVASSLPKALSRMGYEIAVSLPFYGRESFPSGLTVERLVDVDVVMGEETRRGSIYLSRLDGQIPVLLVSQEAYFDRKGLYGDESGDYPDNAERFAFFCRAILSGVKRLGWKPGIVHCNDWQTALIPLYLKTLYSDDHFLGETGSLFTIHNLAYQGIFHRKSLQAVGLKDGSSVSDALEFYGNLNTMKAGLVYADLLSTVSPTYCTEIQTAEYGCGLDGLIRERTNDLYGILNGVDQELWNPECDRDLARNYSTGNPQGKGENKRALQKQNGLSLADVPLVAVVSRLDHQKGLDLITEVIDEMMRLPLQFVFTGKGDVRYEEMFKQIGERFPGKAKIHFSFDVPTAKRVYAGSDILLMPSRYEPCGLAQMKGMRYGTIPVARRTGGLADTIREFDPDAGEGNGFLFEECSSREMLNTLKRALAVYQNRGLWKKLVKNAMAQDFSWERTVGEYVRIYDTIVERHRQRTSISASPWPRSQTQFY